jgi:hypothetical protein
MKKICFLLSFIVFACHSVEDNETAPAPDYLVFRHFYGFCFGEKCIEIFKIENNQLYEDKKDKYPSPDKAYEGDFEKVSDNKYTLVKELINDFPKQLLNEKKTILGTPDAGDWGGYYVEYSYKGVKRFWLIDTMKENIPSYLHNFTDKIEEKIQEVSD